MAALAAWATRGLSSARAHEQRGARPARSRCARAPRTASARTSGDGSSRQAQHRFGLIEPRHAGQQQCAALAVRLAQGTLDRGVAVPAQLRAAHRWPRAPPRDRRPARAAPTARVRCRAGHRARGTSRSSLPCRRRRAAVRCALPGRRSGRHRPARRRRARAKFRSTTRSRRPRRSALRGARTAR